MPTKMDFKSTMGAIYILRRVIKRFREKERDSIMIFINFEKDYSRIPR